jgi:hypothetical protein
MTNTPIRGARAPPPGEGLPFPGIRHVNRKRWSQNRSIGAATQDAANTRKSAQLMTVVSRER